MADDSSQQQQALNFFSRAAQDWRAEAEGKAHKVNVIAQRNQTVLDVIDNGGEVARMLDIGCGSGDLVLAAAEKGVRAHGIDFVPEMIALCEQRKKEKNHKKASFETVSVFDFSWPGERFDVVSALGLVEYISGDQLDELLARAHGLLRVGGIFLLASRNRLFNVFSLNEYSRMEIELGTFADLAVEARSLAEAEKLAEVIGPAARDAQPYPQPDRHPGTWVSVSTRHQYTPKELAGRLWRHDFEPYKLTGIHYFGMPPAVATERPDLHVPLSQTIYSGHRLDHRLVPQCTSFVISSRCVDPD